MRIHAIECGSLRPYGGRLWDGDTEGLGPAHLSCRCLLVEADDGLILVDTGFGLEETRDPVPRLSPAFYLADRVHITPEETAAGRIRALGHHPGDVRHIVMTHLDFDHAGGLTDFPEATVHAHATEILAARDRDGVIAKGRYRPLQLSRIIEGHAEAEADWFGHPAIRLPGLPDDILLVPLPGHTDGHCGVAVKGEGGWVLHAGDAIFMHAELAEPPAMPPLASAYANVMQTDATARLASRDRLRDLHRMHGDEVAILCTHDPSLPAWAARGVV